MKDNKREQSNNGSIPESIHDLSAEELDILRAYRELDADQAERALRGLREIVMAEHEEKDL